MTTTTTEFMDVDRDSVEPMVPSRSKQEPRDVVVIRRSILQLAAGLGLFLLIGAVGTAGYSLGRQGSAVASVSDSADTSAASFARLGTAVRSVTSMRLGRAVRSVSYTSSEANDACSDELTPCLGDTTCTALIMDLDTGDEKPPVKSIQSCFGDDKCSAFLDCEMMNSDDACGPEMGACIKSDECLERAMEIGDNDPTVEELSRCFAVDECLAIVTCEDHSGEDGLDHDDDACSPLLTPCMKDPQCLEFLMELANDDGSNDQPNAEQLATCNTIPTCAAIVACAESQHEPCLATCTAPPTNCDEFEAMTTSGCAATCDPEATAPYGDSLGCGR